MIPLYCSKDVIDEMTSIRYIEYPYREDHVTVLTPQTEIYEAFSLISPEGTLSEHQGGHRKEKKAGRTPGRPKATVNKKAKA